MAGLDAIILLLPKLTSHERAELAERLRVYASIDPNQGVLPLLPGKPAADKDEPALILDCIVRFLESAGVEFTHPTTMRRSRMFASLSRKTPGIMKYIRQGSPLRLEQQQLLMVGIRLLYVELCQMGIAVSSLTLMSRIHRVPAVINAAFPGYAVSGMLHKVVRKQYVSHDRAQAGE